MNVSSGKSTVITGKDEFRHKEEKKKETEGKVIPSNKITTRVNLTWKCVLA